MVAHIELSGFLSDTVAPHIFKAVPPSVGKLLHAIINSSLLSFAATET